jgi:hypothetical protein
MERVYAHLSKNGCPKSGFLADPDLTGTVLLIFHEVMALGLTKNHELSVFRTFFHSAYRYSFDIWYIDLQYQDTD